jgi:hypothetical protein
VLFSVVLLVVLLEMDVEFVLFPVAFYVKLELMLLFVILDEMVVLAVVLVRLLIVLFEV